MSYYYCVPGIVYYPYTRSAVLCDMKESERYSIQIDEANKNDKFLGIVVRFLSSSGLGVNLLSA